MPLKVEIKRWKTVASWHWETGDEDKCSVCRYPFDATCNSTDCRQGLKSFLFPLNFLNSKQLFAIIAV